MMSRPQRRACHVLAGMGALAYVGLALHFFLGSPPQADCPPGDAEKGVRRLQSDGEVMPLKSPQAAIRPGLEGLIGVKIPPSRTNTKGAEKHVYEVERLHPRDLLHPQMTPNSAFWVWCGARWFEFHNYISVLSVLISVRPDNAWFYYDEEPVLDSWMYNTWFIELRQQFPFFRPIKVSASDHVCTGFGKANMSFVERVLSEIGGMYIHEQTMLVDFPQSNRNYSMIHGLDAGSGHGLLMKAPGVPSTLKAPGVPSTLSLKQVVGAAKLNTRTIKCVNSTDMALTSQHLECINLLEVFFPKDIWDADSRLARLVRRLFYGSEEVPIPKQDFSELVPNIAHMAWIGGGEMDFLFYLSVLSLLYVAEVEALYIHGNGPPSGSYWDAVKHHPRVHLIYRVPPGDIFGQHVDVISHVTDIWRVDFMIKYGGIYVDTDTLWVRKLDDNIRAYDAVGSYDWTYWNPPFPDTINFGVAIGKRNAPYWREFQKSMSWWVDSDWSWNGLRQPYRIKERKPASVRIDPRLQVICYNYLCHPTWHPSYHNESVHHANTGSIKDWRSDAYAFHLTLPTPPELQSLDALRHSNTMFAEMGRYILQKAGRWQEKAGRWQG